MYSATCEGDNLSSSTSASYPSVRFSLAQIQSATRNFDDELVIGHGRFWKVYKGQICIGETNHVVAIKRSESNSMSHQGTHEFRTELEMLSNLRHSHLVSLIGFYDDNKERILVYEYMPYGILYHHLHKAETPLNWIRRLKIAIGVGHGLDYLHTYHGVVHRDMKSSNIFLDENSTAMVSDFGLSELGPTNQSSWEYLDPEYFYTGKLTRKTDMYAFGVVLIELLSGRLPVKIGYGEEECSLVRWAQKCVRDGKLDQMVDSNIRGAIAPNCLKGFVEIADLCVLNVLEKQSTMTQVVAKLEDLLEVQEKYNESSQSSGMMGFLSNFHKYFMSATKQNSDQSDTDSLKRIESNMNRFSSTNKDGSDHGKMQHQERKLLTGDVRMFTYDELERATKNFNDETCLNVRSYVNVYKTLVDRTTYIPCNHNTGLLLVIKRLHPYTFFDLNMLKEFCHPNLVKPIGYCLEREHELFLVYGFMHCGNFEGRLHSGFIARFALDKKVQIAVGIARGIVYLHEMQLYGTQHEVEMNPYVMTGSVRESLLDRRKILFDELFIAKLSDYDVTKFVHGHYPKAEDFDDYSHPGCDPFQLRTNLLGFTVVFAEVLTGIPISHRKEYEKIDGLLRQHGKEPLHLIARLCFETCNEVDAESKILKILKDHDKLIRSHPDIKKPRPFSIHIK